MNDRKLFVLTGPSCSGKGTLKKRILPVVGLIESTSHTTREKRSGEENGVHYYFVTRNTFERMRAQNEFVEWAEYCNNLYGTSQCALAEASRLGDTLLEIEVEGARNVKRLFPKATTIFVFPPDPVELERRMRLAEQPRANQEERLVEARREIQSIDEFDWIIENASLDSAERMLIKLIQLLRDGKQPPIMEFKNPTRIRQLKTAFSI